MAGIIVQLIASWIIVWIFEKGSLSFLGLKPTGKRLKYFLLLFSITAASCASGFLLRIYAADEPWQLNPNISLNQVLEGIWWNLKSVLFEELIFRGVLLYILIKKINAKIAIVISAVSFGIYHWFSLGVFGNGMQMLIVFIATGTMGLLLAYAYAKTFSLYFPIAIHLGWNLTQIFIFSQGPIGNGIFMQATQQPFRTDSYLLYAAITFVPMILALLINFFILRKYKQVVPLST